MNILIVNSFYYPNMQGGAEHSVKLLAENLHKEGLNVGVYSLDGKEKNGIECDQINGVHVFRGNDSYFDFHKHVHPNGIIEKTGCRLRSIKNKNIKKDLDYIYSSFSPDVVHVNNVYGISWYVLKYFHEVGAKVVFTIRDYFLMDPKAKVGGSNRFIAWVYQKYMRKKTCRYVDVVTAPSEFTLRTFTEIGYFRNAIKKCVVNSIEFNVVDVNQYVNEKLNRHSSDIRFLYVGALTHEKGVDNLIEAFQQVRNEEISLTLCGDGKLRALVEEVAGKDSRIHYKGQLSPIEVKKEYIKADVLIAPSIWDEPFGRIVIEGNQYGLAVIGSNKAGIAEILGYMQSGECIDSESVLELCKAISKFSDRKYFEKYIKVIPCRLEKYSIHTQVREFINTYSV